MNASESGTSEVSKVGFKRKVAAYVSLTKPRVMELLLAVTIPTMFLAQEGIPNLWLVLVVLLGGMMSAGSAGTFNCYIDRDIDRLMHRTEKRPLVTGEVGDREAVIFASVLAALSTAIFAVFTNWFATALSVENNVPMVCHSLTLTSTLALALPLTLTLTPPLPLPLISVSPEGRDGS